MHTHLTRRTLLGGGAASLLLTRTSLAATPSDSARFADWLENRFQTWVARSHIRQGYLGLGTNLDKWDDISEAHRDADLALARQDLAELRRSFDPSKLNPQDRLSYRLYEFESQRKIDDDRWRFHEYPVNQMSGWQQEIPSFLINIHRIASQADAEGYVARLASVGKLMDQVIERMRLCEKAGVLAPKFIYDRVLRDSRNVIMGKPFAGGANDSPLAADFKEKVSALNINDSAKQKLIGQANAALTGAVGPAFTKLITYTQGQMERAGTDDGVWHLPDGEAFYAHRLKNITTTDMTAEDIHTFGLQEVDRIHAEMHAIMDKVKFKGDLQAFFKFMREDPQFYFPQTEEGKKALIAMANAYVDGMKPHLDELFLTKPKADLLVKAVEPFREQSSTGAFYDAPGAFDGRPGIFYANTFDMKAQPKYGFESIVYHEAIPGHHMQLSLVQEMQGLPKFRRFSDTDYTAYVEGWALYCERIPKEMGFYKDPYSDFGRLTNELWRACRLVVDSGIHGAGHKWSREKAIKYLVETTPNSEGDCVNSIERYIADPGQATAYKIGMTKILDLRENARKKLGAKFDVRQFHDVVLGSGALPLSMLAENVDAWIKSKGGNTP